MKFFWKCLTERLNYHLWRSRVCDSNMRPWTYRGVQVILFAAVTIFPVIFGDKFAKYNWRYILVFFLVVVGLGVVEIVYDTAVASEAKQREKEALEEQEAVSRRLSAQARRGKRMADLMKLMPPTAVRIENLIKIARQLKVQQSRELNDIVERGSEILKGVMEDILRAVSDEVKTYLGSADGEVNSCLMVGHEIQKCSPQEKQRLGENVKFLGYGRDLDSYKAALEIVAWGARDHEVRALVLPVEDGSNCDGKNRLIPGAPVAYALGQDEVIPDTSLIRQHCPPGLDSGIQDALFQYFAGKRFRASAP